LQNTNAREIKIDTSLLREQRRTASGEHCNRQRRERRRAERTATGEHDDRTEHDAPPRSQTSISLAWPEKRTTRRGE